MLMLLKFDLKNTYSKIMAYCGVIALFTAITVYLWSNSFGGFFNDDNFYWITIVKIASLSVTGAVCFICLLLTFITLAQWFAQNLMAEEGHFMNMLPISKLKLFLSKTITAVIWNFVVIAFILLCVYVFLRFGSRLEQINDIMADLEGDSGVELHLAGVFVPLGLYLATTAICVTTLAYTSICLGRTVNIGKNLVCMLGFLGIGLALLIVGIVISYALGAFRFSGLSSLADMLSFFKGFCIKTFISGLINTVICFALGAYLLNGNLNID